MNFIACRQFSMLFFPLGSLDGGKMRRNDSNGSKAGTSNSFSVDYNNYRAVSFEYGRDKNAAQSCGTLGSRCNRTPFIEGYAGSYQSKLEYIL